MTPIHFAINSPEYPKNFPQSITPSDMLLMSEQTLEQSFRAAQDVFNPYFCVAVVQSADESRTYYQIYESSYFATYAACPNFNQQDPVTSRLIEKVHYFIIECFQFDKESICQPTKLGITAKEFVPLKIDDLDCRLKTLILDALNPYILSANDHKETQKCRKIQYVIADFINEQTLFNHLNPSQKVEEVVKWLWCSSQNSNEGRLRLLQVLLENFDIIENFEQKIVDILSSPLSNPIVNEDEEESVALAMLLALLDGSIDLECFDALLTIDETP